MFVTVFVCLCVCVCRDVDDPEYKPAPALLKDDMEVCKWKKENWP